MWRIYCICTISSICNQIGNVQRGQLWEMKRSHGRVGSQSTQIICTIVNVKGNVINAKCIMVLRPNCWTLLPTLESAELGQGSLLQLCTDCRCFLKSMLTISNAPSEWAKCEYHFIECFAKSICLRKMESLSIVSWWKS